jgi:hypothetical protein
MGARNRVEIGLSYRPARLHRLAELTLESIPGLLKRLKIRDLYNLIKGLSRSPLFERGLIGGGEGGRGEGGCSGVLSRVQAFMPRPQICMSALRHFNRGPVLQLTYCMRGAHK